MSDTGVSGDEPSENRNPSWQQLEHRVADLYRAFGFDAQVDVLLSGKQWDVVATSRIPGAGLVTVCVEVKDHPATSLPIDDVRSFVRDAAIALRNQDCVKAALVTSGRITRNSRELFQRERAMEVMTFGNLERQLFDVAEPLDSWLNAYRSGSLGNDSIDLRATLQEHNLNEAANLPGRLPASQLLDVALRHPEAGILIFGDFGTGKTTTLKQLMAEAIHRRQADDSVPVPLLLRLRDFGRAATIEGFVLESIQRDLGFGLRPETFWQLVEQGRFVFLLDGFDEITLRADEARRAELLAALSPVLFSAAPALLTSRPSYFATDDEYKSLLTRLRGPALRTDTTADPGGQRINQFMNEELAGFLDNDQVGARPAFTAAYQLDPLSSDQIDEFLARSSDEFAAQDTTPAEVRTFLDSIYDLSELIRTPVILQMAVRTVARGLIKPSTSTLSNGPAALYEAYAGMALERDWHNVPTRTEGLTMAQRLSFAEECAVEMATTNALTVSATRTATILRRVADITDDSQMDGMLTDVRTCSFLTNAADGGLEFIHRSYQEFFFARRLKADVEGGDHRRLRERLRWEYLYFLGAFGHGNNDFYNALLELSRADLGPTNDAPNNAATAFLAARPTAAALRWNDRTVTGLRRESATIQNSNFEHVRLDELALGALRIHGSELAIVATGGSLGAVRIKQCRGSVELQAAADEVRIEDSTLRVEMFGQIRDLIVDSTELNLTMSYTSPSHLELRVVTGTIKCEPTVLRETRRTVLIEGSTLRFDGGGGETVGEISSSILETPAETFDQLTAHMNLVTLVVRGQRPTSLAKRTAAGLRARSGDHRAEQVLILMDPVNEVDTWWSHQGALITIGGSQGGGEVPIRGITVRTQLPKMTRKDESDNFVRLRPLGGEHLLVEGRGTRLQEGIEELRALTDAPFAKLAGGGWLGDAVRTFAERLGSPGVADALAVAIDAHEQRNSRA